MVEASALIVLSSTGTEVGVTDLAWAPILSRQLDRYLAAARQGLAELAQPLAERVRASLRVLEDLESALGRRQLLDAAPDLAAAAGDPAAVLDLGFVPEEVGCRWGGECSV